MQPTQARVFVPPPPPTVQQASNPWLERVREDATARGDLGKPMGSVDQDLMRIFALPYIPLDVPRCPDREAYAASLYNHARPSDFSLRPIQIDAAYTFETYGGLVAPIGVGWGKTAITMMCAKIAQERRGHYRTLILVPPEVYSQLQHRDLPQLRRWLSIDALPIYLVRGGAKERMRVATQPGPGVFIYSYSSLSTQTGYQELEAICPTCFILDEAHNLANSTSARTKRWMSAVNALVKLMKDKRLGPDVRAEQIEIVAMSGTMTSKSLEDYAHLLRAALRERSPAPIKEQAIKLIGSCIDADVLGTGLGEIDFDRVRDLVAWAREAGYDANATTAATGVHLTFQESVRECFQHRLRTAPGVVSTSDASVGCSLIISWSEAPRPRTTEAEVMSEAMRKVVVDMLTPNLDVIDFGMHTFKWLWELTSGFYNSLVWPTVPGLQEAFLRQGKPITLTESEALLHKAFEHHKLQQDYHKKLRQMLDSRHMPGCDTPMLVALEITKQLAGEAPKFKLTDELKQAYRSMKEAYFDDLPERKSIPIRICDYKIVAAVEWCREHAKEGGLVWYHHPAVGNWLHEYLDVAGIEHTLALSGTQGNDLVFKPGIVLASYAHATGKNLQHQNRNLVLELRREAKTMEQMLGRTHRSGQKADDVRADVLISNGFDLTLFNAILRDSDYIQSTTGQAQRMCYATYAPVIPPTHPRLAVRLGILEREEDAQKVRVKPHESITPPEALDWGDVFRSTRFSTVPAAPTMPSRS